MKNAIQIDIKHNIVVCLVSDLPVVAMARDNHVNSVKPNINTTRGLEVSKQLVRFNSSALQRTKSSAASNNSAGEMIEVNGAKSCSSSRG